MMFHKKFTWCNHYLIFLTLLLSTCVTGDEIQCPATEISEPFEGLCTCQSKTVQCSIFRVPMNSPFWTEFGHLENYTAIELSIFRPDDSTIDFFPQSLFTNLPPSIIEINLVNWKFTTIRPFKIATTSKIETFIVKTNDYFTSIQARGLTSLGLHLVRLQLDSNALRDIDPLAFRGLKSLLEAKLFANNLTSLPDDLFLDSPLLVNLSLATNSITTLRRAAFRGLTNLLELELDHNKLITIKNNTFLELSRLRTLDLSHNQIDSLEPLAFNGLSSITFIDLSNNQLRSLPPELLSHTKILTEIDLKHNQLTRLSDDFLKQLPKTVYLKENQWICDCNLIVYNETLSVDNSEVRCTSSDEFNANGKPVEPIEMTFELFVNTTINTKKCVTTFNYKEKRSHLSVASAMGGQNSSSFLLRPNNFIMTVTLNILIILKISS